MAAAKVEDRMHINEALEAKLRLSMSQNGPTAKGTERPWRCICTEVNDDPFRSCPYHAAVQHLFILKEPFLDQYQQAGFPLFPDSLGNELKGG